ncbi:hypothetical protein DFH07DRAFT_820324 [Mycena maculata]|uniref:Uncharacterized protein n=1 Tax=Mycena maculata TaxID=230809 RepID=A0AAD7J8N4_9AGAR|nr:hypothetical protein DFH07DRAFT_820324 [Mycena maculata]
MRSEDWFRVGFRLIPTVGLLGGECPARVVYLQVSPNSFVVFVACAHGYPCSVAHISCNILCPLYLLVLVLTPRAQRRGENTMTEDAEGGKYCHVGACFPDQSASREDQVWLP